MLKTEGVSYRRLKSLKAETMRSGGRVENRLLAAGARCYSGRSRAGIPYATSADHGYFATAEATTVMLKHNLRLTV